MPRKSNHTTRRLAAKPIPTTLPQVPEDAKLFLNRELALLAFFRRVLEEAQDEHNPLLERVKFIGIVGSILAEFFMVRVAGLKQQINAGVIELSLDGLTPAQQLNAIHQEALRLMNDVRECLRGLLPQLDAAGIHIVDYSALEDNQKAFAKKYFDAVIFPVLTPLAYDPGRPFPHISNMSMNLARPPQARTLCARQSAEHLAAPVDDSRARQRRVTKWRRTARHVPGVVGASHWRTFAKTFPRNASDPGASLSRHARCRSRDSGTRSGRFARDD